MDYRKTKSPGICWFPMAVIADYYKIRGIEQQKCILSLFLSPHI